ncbi:MAG: ABC transporter ATP-binding protein [Planctomycetota bacterium]
MGAAIDIQHLRFSRGRGSQARVILDLPRFELASGAEVCVVGGSGSGKTTLLNLIAGILRPDRRSVAGGATPVMCVGGTDTLGLSEAQRDRWRAQTLGYVFQTFNLLQSLSALENLLIAQSFAGQNSDAARAHALDLLGRVGLGRLVDVKPGRLSVGEQQRVAIARAIVNRPALVLADEPTANLDDEHRDSVLALLRELVKESGSALCLVTHDAAIKAQFDRVESMSELSA